MKKVILIAGGSRGIGEHLVKSLKNEFSLSVCSRTLEWVEQDDFFSSTCDLRNQKDIQEFVNVTLNKFGRIDVLIYNAGLILFDDLLNIKERDIDIMYEVMVKGFLFLCQYVIPVMRKQKSGHIINISSTRGITTAPNKAAYSAIKQAAKSLTDSIAIENGQYKIKVTSIHPGTVDTDSSRKMYKEKLSDVNPIEEDDIVKTVLFLLSLSENAHINTIIIGGKL